MDNMEDLGEMLRKEFRQTIVLTLAAAFCWQGLAAQDQGQYRIEYAVYEAAKKIEDPGKRAAALIDFIGKFPESSLIPYVDSDYRAILEDQFTKQNWDLTLELTQNWLAIRPDDPLGLYFTAYIYFQKGQQAKAIAQSEKLYGSADADTKKTLSYILAFSAVQTGDINRIIQYGDDACQQFSPKECYPVNVELMRHYSSKQSFAKASAYADKALKGLALADAQDATTKDYVRKNTTLAYALKGSSDFERKSWNSAIRNYRRVLRSTSNKALVGECYYKIGLSYWRLEKIEPEAMQAFARGHKRGTGQHAQKCYKHLEELYKVRHNGSVAGMDEFIDRALSSE